MNLAFRLGRDIVEEDRMMSRGGGLRVWGRVAAARSKPGVFPSVFPAAGQKGAANVDPQAAAAALEGVGACPETTCSTLISRTRIGLYTAFCEKDLG